MKLIVGRISSACIAVAWAALVGARLVLDLIGYSTAPEDVEVAQTRLDQFIGWLLSVPWWALLSIAFASTVWLMWVSWPRQVVPSSSTLTGEERRTDSRHHVEPTLGSNIKPTVPAALPKPRVKVEAAGIIRPLSETTEDKQAKHDLAIFSAEHIIPTYQAVISLQEKIVEAICGRHTVIAVLAWKAFQKEANMREYTEHIHKLERAIGDDIANISLRQLVDSLYAISQLHPALCAFNDWLAFVGNGRVGPPFDYKSNEATAKLYRDWRERQNALVAAFQPFRRDIRFPRFYDLSGKRGLGHPFEIDA